MAVLVEQLTKTFGSQRAVDAISFRAEDGQILGFLGPNGAGKSTTMKMLTGYLQPDGGRATVAGYDVVEDGLNARRQIGYLPENNPLYTDMYIREYLEWVAGFYQIDKPRKRVSEMIDMVGLGQESHKKIGQLSKGYRQRVGLAQALMHDPAVLLLDEPTSGLDPNQLIDIRNLIRELGKNKTILFSTHIMQEVAALCDRMLIIHKGRLVADGPVAELQQQLSGSSRVVVRSREAVDGKAFSAIKGVQRVDRREGGKLFHLDIQGDDGVNAEIFKVAAAQGWTLTELHVEPRGVEDVFQELTKDQ
ncbi:MAG: gliding motility-associated ABC transporter ATP-binding subunit GldA [Saprospiraceae bacterium]|nr:gliding motility-associated ABC transporter ATP-binding subunit GldA [Saprospiraceae bacterium]